MAESTEISWCDSTWSPWEGCTQVSPGCTFCYAESMNRWLRKGANWGPGAPRREYSDEHWQKPLKWNAKAAKDGKRLRVFPSVCDPFDNEVGKGRRQDFFRLIRSTPSLDWLLLTKRIGNADAMIEEAICDMEIADDPTYKLWPWPNVWLGATVVNQEEADRDIPKLLAVTARVRFLSIEPMLGPIDLHDHLIRQVNGFTQSIDWVIAGGESGPHARPAHPDWFRSLRQQCAAAGVAWHLKQHGEWLRCESEASTDRPGRAVYLEDGYGVELPDRGLRIIQAHGAEFVHVGKKLAGRLLDGVEHNGFPA